jgi:hypothetical protein
VTQSEWRCPEVIGTKAASQRQGAVT